MIGSVNPAIAALLGALAGLLLGGLAVALAVRSRLPEAPPTPTLTPEDLDAVVQSMRSAVAVVGPNDDLVSHNDAARALGVVRGTRLGVAAVHDLVRQVRAGSGLIAVNLDQKRGHGRPDSRWAVRVVPLGEGRTLVVADDREPALRVQATNRDFMANATHELKTPIGAISLLAEAAEEASDDPDAARRFAGRIRAEAERLSALVAQSITLSKLQSHDPRANADPVDVDDVVERALDRSRQSARGRGVTLTSVGEPGLTVTGDAEQLETALTNLIQNAISYSDPHARVAVSARLESTADGTVVAIAVSDNGLGIAQADQQRVFERFFRVDAARSRETGGTGMGLTIVREIAEGHGGDVSVWSEPGQGSTFTLRIPALEDTEGEA